MKPIAPDKTEIAFGLHPMDVRTIDVFTVDRRLPNKPERELQLAKRYWLEEIRPHIVKRKLQGAEFFVAARAHTWLTMMTGLATHWNDSEEGKKSPIPVGTFPELGKEEFNAPEEFCADESLKPETLAGIAATVMNKGEPKLTPADAVRSAHDLYVAAKQFIGTMPQKQGTGSINQISFQALAALRWDRFKSKCERERIKALKKKSPESKKPKSQLPMSAATSPITVGKRQK